MNNELPEEVAKENRRTHKVESVAKLSLLLLGVILFGIYVGQLLFGVNSLEVLINLQTNKIELQKEIKRLKYENAKLQKEYFELLELTSH